ncbi:MAG: dTMP kinase [Candidatus Thorarchaeota archaeon]|nr:dTMP kinase [Candidatus Thorarchaeota archaeon]
MSENERKNWTGFLFVLEGIDGAGKTVATEHLEEQLRNRGYDVLRLREPTSESPWGQEIRERSPRGELTPQEELDLFLKDREWHVQNKILPALRSGKVILLDRYFFASGAYQSTSTGLHWSEILRRNREVIHAPEPDIVFILDIPVEVGLERLGNRHDTRNLQFEIKERLQQVRQAYLEMIAQDIGHFVLIDATRPLETVVEEILFRILKEIARKRAPEGNFRR